ncbi:TetR/AcrR family transcriptional regulator [Streptacidiphilus sp. P02-A3a]|uniref:TetR/AcrR family transcriptional regulator n=1 Tax=Streptacidiphilus sp. P02-A3a TaxID=2704468 RepID=UPI0015FCFFB9|nr:TetR/AcrR family transcriptional regulator [Streptacidiphilus sp. P02-A3a]QMU72496.1 TetR/AcrR family transcriptional regulator [Streptacidiphilus sp. P02-A3a]
MTDSAAPPRKGRPRNADADEAILAATRTVLAEQGWGGLTMGDVAARAGVAKTTLYRRWPSKNELVVSAVAVLFDELEMADLGSLQADIEAVVQQFADLLAQPESRSALLALFAEATRDPALRLRVREAITDPQKQLVRQGRAAAQARGELPPDENPAQARADVDVIFDTIAGAVEHRMLVTGEPASPEWIRRFTTLLLTPMTAPESH